MTWLPGWYPACIIYVCDIAASLRMSSVALSWGLLSQNMKTSQCLVSVYKYHVRLVILVHSLDTSLRV